MDETSFWIVKYRQKLQKTYIKLKPREKINFKQIQKFICRSITFVHKLELIA